jgi:hypothetical protein
MIETTAARILEEMGEWVPDRRPPSAELLRAGKRAKAKRSRRNLGLLSIAMLVPVAGIVFLGPLRDPDAGSSPVAEIGENPVISMSQPDNSFPAAEVTGEITMQRGCLLVGNSVAFWPFGTTWDGNTQTVVFAETLAKLPVKVGSTFDGTGGFYTGDQAATVVGGENGDVIRECVSRTNAEGAVFAVPSD